MKNETSHNIEIYQLRIYIRHISPIIWRRILVRNDSTIADLHYTLQIAFGLSDSYLHQFVIRGKHYGIAKPGGIDFEYDPYKIRLKDFGFYSKERFIYEYNFHVPWEYEIRIEKTLPLKSRKIYPVCIGGNRAAPPENCNGPDTFMRLKQKYSLFYIGQRLIEILKDKEEYENCREEIPYLKYWYTIEQFDRKAVNEYLKLYGSGDKDWEKLFEEVISIL